MNTNEARRQIARIIHEVIDKNAQVSEIIRRHPDLSTIDDESVIRAIHALGHYESDNDIMQKDKAYAELQVKALRAMADQLSKGLPLTSEHGYWQEQHS